MRFENWRISLGVHRQIFSFSKGIFAHWMRLDQSRISEKYLIDYEKRFAAADKSNKKLGLF